MNQQNSSRDVPWLNKSSCCQNIDESKDTLSGKSATTATSMATHHKTTFCLFITRFSSRKVARLSLLRLHHQLHRSKCARDRRRHHRHTKPKQTKPHRDPQSLPPLPPDPSTWDSHYRVTGGRSKYKETCTALRGHETSSYLIRSRKNRKNRKKETEAFLPVDLLMGILERIHQD
jgi:hypothetical protein